MEIAKEARAITEEMSRAGRALRNKAEWRDYGGAGRTEESVWRRRGKTHALKKGWPPNSGKYFSKVFHFDCDGLRPGRDFPLLSFLLCSFPLPLFHLLYQKS